MPERPRLTPAIADVRRAVRETWDAVGVQPGDQILVACSGGADSLALAAAAQFEGARAGIPVGAVIIEHGLQEATKDVASLTAKLLGELGLAPVLVREVEVSSDPAAGGTEAAARTARYDELAIAAEALDAKFVMLGHTLDDQAETVLLGLTRGSGPRSIAGMQPVNGLWLRPLLGIRRETTEAFCHDSELDFWVDPHNSDVQFTRVRIRRNVLPLLEKELGPGVAQALARTAEILAEDLAYFEGQALAEFQRLAKVGSTGIELEVAELERLPKVIRIRVFQKALELLGQQNSRTHLTAVNELIENWHGQKELTLPGVRVVRKGELIAFKTTKSLNPGAC